MSTTKKSLTEKVAAYKLIARESLRMALISPRLSRISSYEEDLASKAEIKKELEHEIAVINYETLKLDTEHPNYEKNKTRKDESLKSYTESLENLDKNVEEVNKLITEQKEAIAKIESGETKVSKDALNDLVEAMISKDALNQVSTCETC